MTQETPDFIARHVAEIRELAPRLGAGALSILLAKSASIIEQLRDGLSASRVAAHAAQDEHERRVLSMQADLAALQARSEATAARVAELLGAIMPAEPAPSTAVWKNLPCSPTDLNALIKLMPGGWAEIEWSAEASTFVVLNSWGITPEDPRWALQVVMTYGVPPIALADFASAYGDSSDFDIGDDLPTELAVEQCEVLCVVEYDPGDEHCAGSFGVAVVKVDGKPAVESYP